jgi:hypothetical protein
MFKLSFKTYNAAFTDNGDRRIEVVRLLREIAERIEDNRAPSAGDSIYGSIVDANSNTIGQWTMIPGR